MTRRNDRIIDENVTGDHPLPTSRGADAVTVDRSGIRNQGYLDKHDTPHGSDATLLHLPPGMNIEDQHTSRASEAGEIPFKRWAGHAKGYVEVGTANSSTRKR